MAKMPGLAVRTSRTAKARTAAPLVIFSQPCVLLDSPAEEDQPWCHAREENHQPSRQGPAKGHRGRGWWTAGITGHARDAMPVTTARPEHAKRMRRRSAGGGRAWGDLPKPICPLRSHKRCIGPYTVEQRGTPCTFPFTPQGD